MKSRHLTTLADKLTYGMTKQQVVRRIGRPERVAGSCWQYSEHLKLFNSGGKLTLTGERMCFSGSGNTYSNSYSQINGKWREPGNDYIVIAPPTS